MAKEGLAGRDIQREDPEGVKKGCVFREHSGTSMTGECRCEWMKMIPEENPIQGRPGRYRASYSGEQPEGFEQRGDRMGLTGERPLGPQCGDLHGSRGPAFV